MTLWLLTPNQTRHKLIDPAFRPCFYVSNSEPQLRELALRLQKSFRVSCREVERTDIWQAKPIVVLEVALHDPLCFHPAVQFVLRMDSRARLYDADLMPASLYSWQKDVFPLARIEVETDEHGQIGALACKDDPWALDYETPPLCVMQVRLAGLARVNPEHGRRGALEVETDGETHVLDDSDIPAADSFACLLKRYDPDLLLTEWGDSMILPGLLQQAERSRIPLRLNRDSVAVHHARPRSYMSYGRILFKSSTTTLFGRLHVDARNSFIADKCELAGLWELARISKLPVQYAARTTTGTGISYMQMELAWRDGVLIPAQKAEPEDFKSPDELLAADRGGLVFVPKLGFFSQVAELDFVSEYPSIMARFNISPETVNCPCCPDAPRVPELGYRICRRRRGITSRVVERLIAKRRALKERLRAASAQEAMRYRLQRNALKWLLVCCFGYTGYKNARFGKIEAHEAINAVARETLLVAKEIAENRGFELLHALVDSLYVQKEGATREDYEQLTKEIEQRTLLPIAVEALYRYVVFLPSRQFEDIPVPNRFFAVSEEGELKVRGLESRRHDTPPLVVRMQKEVLAILSEAHDEESYRRKLEEARAVLARYIESVQQGSVAIEDLVISKRISRAPRDYRKASLTAVVGQQLFGCEVKLRPGENVEYIITDAEAAVPNDRARAFALWEGWRGYDRKKYRAMLVEAFEPFQTPLRAIDKRGGGDFRLNCRSADETAAHATP
jgi:DNA polymerase-2